MCSFTALDCDFRLMYQHRISHFRLMKNGIRHYLIRMGLDII
jgi:hypothetical protein